MTPLKLAILNLTRRKISSMVSLIAIALSVACSGILLRLYTLSNSRFETLASGGDAVIGAKAGGLEILLGSLNLEGPFPDFLPFVLYQSLKAQSSVQFEDKTITQTSFSNSVIPILYFGKFKNYRVIGTDESFLKRPRSEDSPLLLKGRWAQALDEAVLGSTVAKNENLHLEDHIEIQPWVGQEVNSLSQPSIKLKVVGIFEPTHTAWDHGAFTNIEQAQKTLANLDLSQRSIWKNKVLSYFLVYLKPNGFGPLKDLINRRTVAQVISVPEEKKKLEDLTGTGRLLSLFICSFIMLLGGLSVAAMMITRFDSMTLQLAVLRALGYQKLEIAKWLLWEGLLLGLGACLIGGTLDMIFFPELRFLLGSALPDSTWVESSILQSSPVWVAAILATTAAIFIPLIRLYRQDVHLSLKGY